MTTYTFTLARELKGGYVRYENATVGSIYLSKGMLLADAASVTVTADFAEPKAAKELDPAVLQAKADKASERAKRATEQAQKLAEQAASLKAAQPSPTAPAPKSTRKTKVA
jgi:F0F1-type ATP synthase epsilon subunit